MSALERCARAAPVLAVTALAAAASPPIPEHPRSLTVGTPALRAPDAARHRTELSNGSVLYVVEDHSLPLVEVAVAARAGRYLEPAGKAGLAGLVGPLMRSGGAGSYDAAALDRAIDRLGADLRIGIGELRVAASLSAPTWTLEPALELFFEVVARPRFQEDRLQTLLGNLVEGMRRRNEDPLDVLEREWTWLLHGTEHFLTRAPTTGSVATIRRQDLVALHRRCFRPGRLLFAVSGDVDPEAIRKRIEGALAEWPEPGGPEPEWPPAAPGHAGGGGLYHVEADTPQAKVLIGHAVSPRPGATAAERAALELMNEVLGGSDAISRIAGRLRTAAGLAYRATASYDLRRPWGTEFRVFFETENRSAARAVAAARQEIERIREQPVHPQELEVARQALLASIRRSFDSAESTAGYLAEDELLGRPPGNWRKRYDALQEVTNDGLRAAAREALRPRDLIYLVVGRAAELELGKSANPFDPSPLERAAGYPVRHLPARDPMTLEPIAEPVSTDG